MTDIRSLEQTLLDNLLQNKARIKFVARFLLTLVSLIGIKPIIKCVSHQSCEHMETRPSLSGTGKNFVRQEP
jgi:hypothetical protein